MYLTSKQRHLAYATLSLTLMSSIPGAYAEIRATARTGFALQFDATIQAPPNLLYRSLVKDIGLWWDSEHTYSGNSKNLYIEDKPQGCFCEKLKNTPAVQHMNIIYAAPGELLRMQGGLGPLQAMAVTGSMSWRFVQSDSQQKTGTTEIHMTYNVTGYTPEGLDKLASAVNSVLEQQFTRYQNHIKTRNRLQSKG